MHIEQKACACARVLVCVREAGGQATFVFEGQVSLCNMMLAGKVNFGRNSIFPYYSRKNI